MEWPLMAHQACGAPLLCSSGAPCAGGPLVWSTLMVHQTQGALLVTNFNFFYFARHTNGAPGHSAPLLVVTSNGAPAT